MINCPQGMHHVLKRDRWAVCVAMVPRLQGDTVRQYTQSGLRHSSGETAAALGWEMQRKTENWVGEK